MKKLSRIFGARDWEAMRALYHPEALLQTVIGGSEPVAPEELIAGLERASRGTWFSVQNWKNLAIDDHAVLIVGRMRRSMPSGGFEDASHVWLLTVRDGLIYRQGVFSTTDAAADAYSQLGVSLGVADVTVPGGAGGARSACGIEAIEAGEGRELTKRLRPQTLLEERADPYEASEASNFVGGLSPTNVQVCVSRVWPDFVWGPSRRNRSWLPQRPG